MESTTLLVLSYFFKVFVFTKPSLAADEHWVSAETSSSTYNHTSCHRKEWCDPCSTDLTIKLSAESKYRRFRTLSPPRSNRLLLLAGLKEILVLIWKIGIYIEDNGVGTLSLSDALQPFKVQLKKVLKTTS
ncbi:hypothetical protein OIU79_022739 [Salix purpurea]|uniref:Uncharacterized protein n=1 Tax=Salix purpurea TaxID=77065 RepID=A0A9Q1AD80_SALPP|nr:hypothetical protein OIU79_022739 [Salix purpurea]